MIPIINIMIPTENKPMCWVSYCEKGMAVMHWWCCSRRGEEGLAFWDWCVCVCVRVRVWHVWGLGCDWLSARHDVSQLLIREAMKGPPLWNCALCSRLIRKTEILLSLGKKTAQQAQLPRSKLCRLSSGIHAVEKLDKICKMSQRVGLWWNEMIRSGRKRGICYLMWMSVTSFIHCFQ